jgi:hypothetical protein
MAGNPGQESILADEANHRRNLSRHAQWPVSQGLADIMTEFWAIRLLLIPFSRYLGMVAVEWRMKKGVVYRYSFYMRRSGENWKVMYITMLSGAPGLLR